MLCCSRKYKSRPNICCPICANGFNNRNQLQFITLEFVFHFVVLGEEVFGTCALPSTPHLYFFLIHVVDVSPRNVVPIDCLLDELEVSMNCRVVEGLCPFGIKSTSSASFQVRSASFQESLDPAF